MSGAPRVLQGFTRDARRLRRRWPTSHTALRDGEYDEVGWAPAPAGAVEVLSDQAGGSMAVIIVSAVELSALSRGLTGRARCHGRVDTGVGAGCLGRCTCDSMETPQPERRGQESPGRASRLGQYAHFDVALYYPRTLGAPVGGSELEDAVGRSSSRSPMNASARVGADPGSGGRQGSDRSLSIVLEELFRELALTEASALTH